MVSSWKMLMTVSEGDLSAFTPRTMTIVSPINIWKNKIKDKCREEVRKIFKIKIVNYEYWVSKLNTRSENEWQPKEYLEWWHL